MTDKWTFDNIPDLTGKTYIVTGAAGGIGLITTREIARAGADVVMAVRNIQKGRDAARSISAVRGNIDVQQLDVSNFASIRAFADAWSGPITGLVNNAGIMSVPRRVTDDGIESQVATNYFGPFALTNALLPHITDRVISISSQLHRMGRLRVNDLTGRKRRYSPWFAYCDSKLDILLFSSELQRRLEQSGSPVRSMIAHPGIAQTNLVAHVGGVSGWMNGLAQPLLNEAENGALPTLFALTPGHPRQLLRRPGQLRQRQRPPRRSQALRRCPQREERSRAAGRHHRHRRAPGHRPSHKVRDNDNDLSHRRSCHRHRVRVQDRRGDRPSVQPSRSDVVVNYCCGADVLRTLTTDLLAQAGCPSN